MVILFAERKSRIEKEIIEILKSYGGNYISDKAVHEANGNFTIISEYKKTDIAIKKGIAIFCDETSRFEKQTFPMGITGICEENNISALQVFKKSNTPVICCGLNSKNTVTLSHFGENTPLVTLQRTLTDILGNEIYAGEFKINLSKAYSPFSVMASVTALLLNGIKP